MSLDSLLSDPQFANLPAPAKQKVLAGVSTDFAALPPDKQLRTVMDVQAHIAQGNMAQQAPALDAYQHGLTQPGFSQGYAQGMGVPEAPPASIGDAAKQLAPYALGPGGPAMVGYGQSLLNRTSQAGQQVKEAMQNIAGGQPFKQNAMKAASGIPQVGIAAIPGGEIANQVGEAADKGNYRQAAGLGTAALLQAAAGHAVSPAGGNYARNPFSTEVATPHETLAGVIAPKLPSGMDALNTALPATNVVREVAGKIGVTPEQISSAGIEGPKIVQDVFQKTIKAHNDYSDLVTQVADPKTPVDGAGLAAKLREASGDETNPHVQASLGDWADRLEGIKNLDDLNVLKKELNKVTNINQKRISRGNAGDVINDLRHEGDMKARGVVAGELYRILGDRTGVDMQAFGQQEKAVINASNAVNRVATEVRNNEMVRRSSTTAERLRGAPRDIPTSTTGIKASLIDSALRNTVGMSDLQLFNSRMARVFEGPSPQSSSFPTITQPSIAGRLGPGATQLGAVPQPSSAVSNPAMNLSNLMSTRAQRLGLQLKAPPTELPGQVQATPSPPVLERVGGPMAESGLPAQTSQPTPMVAPENYMETQPLMNPRMAKIAASFRKKR